MMYKTAFPTSRMSPHAQLYLLARQAQHMYARVATEHLLCSRKTGPRQSTRKFYIPLVCGMLIIGSVGCRSRQERVSLHTQEGRDRLQQQEEKRSVAQVARGGATSHLIEEIEEEWQLLSASATETKDTLTALATSIGYLPHANAAPSHSIRHHVRRRLQQRIDTQRQDSRLDRKRLMKHSIDSIATIRLGKTARKKAANNATSCRSGRRVFRLLRIGETVGSWGGSIRQGAAWFLGLLSLYAVVRIVVRIIRRIRGTTLPSLFWSVCHAVGKGLFGVFRTLWQWLSKDFS